MRVQRRLFSEAQLADGHASAWEGIEEQEITLVPAPLALTESVSPYLSRSTGHGKIDKIRVRMVHDGSTLSIRLNWHDPEKDDELNDLDQFTDAAAIMFPLLPGASAMTMGTPEKPITAWLWKADENEPFDVFAQGYATSNRRRGAASGLTATSYHDDDRWTVVFQRSLSTTAELVATIEPGSRSAIAFAVWEGSNNERSGQKSVSGEFTQLAVEA